MPKGLLLDRFGYPGGAYTSPYGTSYASRALEELSLKKPYYVYQVMKPLPAESSTIAPWFNMSGGGVQYKFTESVEWYVQKGYLKEIRKID